MIADNTGLLVIMGADCVEAGARVGVSITPGFFDVSGSSELILHYFIQITLKIIQHFKMVLKVPIEI